LEKQRRKDLGNQVKTDETDIQYILNKRSTKTDGYIENKQHPKTHKK